MSRLQIHLSARNLKNLKGFMTKSDPFAIVTVRGDNENNSPQIVGQTDVVFNNLNPSWSRTIYIEGYKFGVPFYFEVGVFDFKNPTNKSEHELSRMDVNAQVVLTDATRDQMRHGKFPHKIMGTALFEVGEVLASRGNVASKQLQTGGALYVTVERCSGETGKVRFHLRGLNLQNTQTLGRTSSPFYELYRKVDRPTGASWISVYRSNTVRKDLSPLWGEVTLDLESICKGDLDKAMKVIVWDYRRTGKHKMMGEFETTMRRFIEAAENHESPDFGFSLNKVDKLTGTIVVLDATVTEQLNPSKRIANGNDRQGPRPEFVDYLSGGCQISLAVAIDFTASNGDPRQPGTPHYFHPPESKEWNDYEKAIFAVGSILAKYDTDQKFPVWGFGAKYNNVVRHCFQCGNDVEVEGVQGIMDAYRGVFRTPLTMSYPTDLTEVVQTAASYARHEQEVAEDEGSLSYTILLVLTAGNVENAKETKRTLIEASEDPLSIVIVGIGDTDFTDMEFLDEHDPVREGGRDITKFVRFSDFKSFNALTEAVLDEIPHQLVDYFFERNIFPGKLEHIEHDDLEVAPADDETRTTTFLG